MTTQSVRNEMLIDGTWADVSIYTRGRDTANVSIARGGTGEQAYLSSGTCNFTLNNRDGRFSNRNPTSPYFGLIGLNTQFRSGLTTSSPYIRFIDASDTDGNYDGAEVVTADKAALDITGDIDIRMELDLEDWNGRYGQVLASKYTVSGNQRSWYLLTDKTGNLNFSWSPDGTLGAVIPSVPSTNPRLSGRCAIRVTLDVNNGSGGYTVTWYTSTSITGTWTQFSQTVTTGGTTSIFSGSGNLEIGAINGAAGRQATFSGVIPLVGKVYGFELRNGIGGSKVAEITMSGRTRGDTSWSDGLGNTWTCAASAAVDDSDYRFWGETSNLPQRWDSTGTDVFVPVQAGDLLQRLQSGRKPLRSPIYRNLSRYTLDQWNTCEDGGDATTLGAAAGNAGTISETSFVSDTDFPGADGVLSFTADTGYAQANIVTPSNTGTAFWLWYFKLNAIPASSIEPLYVFYTGGTLAKVAFSVSLTTWTITATSSAGAVIGTSSVAFGSTPPNEWTAMRLLLTQSGSDINFEWAWYGIGGAFTSGTSGTWTGFTCGRPKGYLIPAFTGKSGMRMSHIVLNRADVAFSDPTFTGSTNAYVGEDPLTRFGRLAREEGVPWFIRGRTDGIVTMGAQTPKNLVDLWQECAEVAGALLYCPRDKFGVTIRSMNNIINRYPLPEINYSSFHLSGQIEPEEVTTGVVNDMTASRPSGSFRRYVKTSGARNVNDPSTDPEGIGTYDATITRNVGADDDLQTQAEWEVALSTWDELRYPSLQVELHRSPFTSSTSLTESVKRLDLGDAFTLADLPSWLPPEDVDQLVRGYSETYDNFLRTIVFNCTAYGPYDFGIWADDVADVGLKRYDSASTTLAATKAAGVSPLGFTSSNLGDIWTVRYANFDAVCYENGKPGERFTCLWISNVGSIAALEGGFETGITGWTASGTMTLTQSTDFAHVGTYSCKGVVTGSPSTASILNSAQITVSATTAYSAVIWVYATTSVANVNIIITWYTSGGVFISNSTGVAATLAANTWTQFTVSATSPGTAGLARYGVIVTGSPAAGTTIYADDFDMIATASGVGSAGPYVQTVYVTRAVNGIAKSLPSGSEIHVFERGYWGRG